MSYCVMESMGETIQSMQARADLEIKWAFIRGVVCGFFVSGVVVLTILLLW